MVLFVRDCIKIIISISDSNADPSIQAAQINLKRKKLQDDLNERLLMRPGPLELVNKNILDPNSFVGHAVKEGALEYTDTKNSTLIVNALSPPESFNDDSPQPSPDSTSIGSPSEPSPSPVFPTPPKVMFQSNQPSYPVTSHMKLKDTKSRKKTSKAKFKKYKYHEYRPPNTESNTSKSDTTLPADSPYALLLQQQQLYLQLQVLCQNYPQTFLPLLPAVQKNNQSESQPAEKPMKLEEMRVIDLRNELKSRGLPVSGSKNNLMERLKLANAAQESGNSATVTSSVSMVTQTTPVPVAPRTTLTRSTSAPVGVAMVNSIRPAKIFNDADKILQMEQNISLEEIQQKIQQLQYLNVQLQLQQLDLKKSQQGKTQQSKNLSTETTNQIPTMIPNQQPLHHPNLPQSSQLTQQQQLQPQQKQQQQAQLGAQNQVQQQQQQKTIQVKQQQLEQHLKQLKQLQQQQQVGQQQDQKQQMQQQQQLKHQQFQQQQKLLQQQQQLQPQQANQQLNQQLLYNQLPKSPTPSISLPTKSESSDVKISTVASLPPPQQCQVSISATPLLHCSTLTCNKNCSHVQEASADTATTSPNMNSVQQHNVIHFKQPVKPVIILQPAKPQQRAELLFSPPGQQLTSDMGSETFFQQLNKNDGVSSLHGDINMEQDTNWQPMMDSDTRSSTTSPTAVERSPPPYFEAVAGKLSPRSTSFSTSNPAATHKTQQRTNSAGSTSPLANRRSLSVPSVNHGSVQQQDLQKGHKSVSTMCLDFPEADEMSDMADNYHGITQELQKVNFMFRAVARALIGGGGGVYSYIRAMTN